MKSMMSVWRRKGARSRRRGKAGRCVRRSRIGEEMSSTDDVTAREGAREVDQGSIRRDAERTGRSNRGQRASAKGFHRATPESGGGCPNGRFRSKPSPSVRRTSCTSSCEKLGRKPTLTKSDCLRSEPIGLLLSLCPSDASCSR
jgi:hypothetical protein